MTIVKILPDDITPHSDLELHVLLAQERYEDLDKRLTRIEVAFDQMIERSAANKKLITGAIVTVITSTISALIVLLLNFLKH